VFTFDTLDVGFVSAATNAVTVGHGFTFPDAGDPLAGEYIASASEGGHVLDVLGEGLNFDGRVTFRFEDVVETAGIDYDSATDLFLIAYDAAGDPINPDGSITAAGGTAGFFGIWSDLGIRELVIHDTAGSFQLDNLRFGTLAAPTPAAWLLGALGLGLVGFVRRKI
jgi:hypothetical protein